MLLTIDALRPDHLSTYGYERKTDPAIAGLAGDAVVFKRAFSTAAKTTPAHASILTGLYPYRHGLRLLGQKLADANLTVAEILSAGGYQSAGFVSSTVMIDRLSGLGQGFSYWNDYMPEREAGRANYEREAGATVNAVLEWLGERRSRIFLFVHLIDPHGPYIAPEPFREKFHRGGGSLLDPALIPAFQRLSGAKTLDDYVDAYDNEIAYADHELGRLLAALKRVGLYDRALILLTADHGESLGDNGFFFRHGLSLHEASTAVPLIVKPPGGRAKGVRAAWEGPVSLVDLMPTILDYAGLPRPAALDGISLRPILEGRAVAGKRWVFSERVRGKRVDWAAHGPAETLLASACGHEEEIGSGSCRLDLTVTVAGKGPRQRDDETQQALAEFVRHALGYRLGFSMKRRYRPTNRRFIDRFIAQHNQRYKSVTAGDAQALRSLGYLE